MPEPVSPTIGDLAAGLGDEARCPARIGGRVRVVGEARRRRTRPRRARSSRSSVIASGLASSMSTGRSRYSNTRSKSASEDCTSACTMSSDADREEEPRLQRREGDQRADRDRRAAGREQVAGDAVHQRRHDREGGLDRRHHPAAGHALAQLELGQAAALRTKRSVSSSLWPIVLPSSTPETESDSSTSVEMSASEPCFVEVISRRSWPMRAGHAARTPAAARRPRSRAASRGRSSRPTWRRTVVTFETIDVAVDVTTVWTPPMSFAMRRLHLAGARAREEGEREPLQVPVDGGAQVVHDLLADAVRLPGLGDADDAGSRSGSRPCRRRAGRAGACRDWPSAVRGARCQQVAQQERRARRRARPRTGSSSSEPRRAAGGRAGRAPDRMRPAVPRGGASPAALTGPPRAGSARPARAARPAGRARPSVKPAVMRVATSRPRCGSASISSAPAAVSSIGGGGGRRDARCAGSSRAPRPSRSARASSAG